MAGVIIQGQTTWKMTRTADGDRDYKISFYVRTSSSLDGPSVVLNTPGLPRAGDTWRFDNDFDLYATCNQEAEVEPMLEMEPNKQWKVTFTFTTKNRKRCQDDKVEDPMLEPPKVNGGMIKDKEEATKDRNDAPIVSSSWEQIRGPQVEFDKMRPKITIEQNVLTFAQAFILPAQMANHVNSVEIWGVPPRMVRLSDHTFERKYYGQCYKYYTRKLEFEVNYETFDRKLLDEGTKVLNGRWSESTGNWDLLNVNGQPPDPMNPRHFVRFKDRNGENCRVILDGHGKPAGVVSVINSLFISAPARTGVGFNDNIQVTDSRYWVPLMDPTQLILSDFDLADEWENGAFYNRSEIVEFEGTLYICWKDIRNKWEAGDTPSNDWAQTGDHWRLLMETDLAPTEFIDKGVWDSSQTYPRGNYVQAGSMDPPSGIINLEYYQEADLRLLGVPLIL